MQREQAMSYFRRLAKLLHPDKNHHPMAKEAFQKFSEAMQVVSSSPSSQPQQQSSSFWKNWNPWLKIWAIIFNEKSTSFINEHLPLDNAIIWRDLLLNTFTTWHFTSQTEDLIEEYKARTLEVDPAVVESQACIQTVAIYQIKPVTSISFLKSSCMRDSLTSKPRTPPSVLW